MEDLAKEQAGLPATVVEKAKSAIAAYLQE